MASTTLETPAGSAPSAGPAEDLPTLFDRSGRSSGRSHPPIGPSLSRRCSSIGLGALFSGLAASRYKTDPSVHIGWDATDHSLRSLLLGQLAFALLGVMTVTSEYSTGMIRTSLAAVPRRFRMMSSKLLVLLVVLLIAGQVDRVRYLRDRPGAHRRQRSFGKSRAAPGAQGGDRGRSLPGGGRHARGGLRIGVAKHGHRHRYRRGDAVRAARADTSRCRAGSPIRYRSGGRPTRADRWPPWSETLTPCRLGEDWPGWRSSSQRVTALGFLLLDKRDA